MKLSNLVDQLTPLYDADSSGAETQLGETDLSLIHI